MNDGSVIFDIVGDKSNLMKSITDATKSIEKESKNWEKSVNGSTDNITKSMARALDVNRIKDWAIQGAKAVGEFVNESINAASDLEEVQNVVDVTFGESANQINNWAKNAGTQFGLTETQAKKFASTLGAMFKSSGITGSEITQMSKDLSGLAADMASFYNLDFETAFQKIRSGISGETEPLKQLGINMSVANLEAYALSQGIEKAFNSMSQGEQTMLRYQYIMQATADAQGDFSRTSDGFANSMRTFETNVESLKTKVGTLLLPVVNDVISSMNQMLTLLTGDSKRTVLDDFAEIDLNTASKIAEIEETSNKARELIDVLNKIENGVGDINLTPETAGAWSTLLDALGSDSNALANLTGKSVEESAEWLQKIKDAASGLDSNDVDGWSKLLGLFVDGIPGLDEGTGIQALQSLASVAGYSQEQLLQLGIDSESIAQRQALWLETCRELVNTIPGLSSIINVETGEVKGGTQAIAEYVDAWEQGQKKLALIQAHQAKQSALATAEAEVTSYELAMLVAKRRLKKAREAFEAAGGDINNPGAATGNLFNTQARQAWADYEKLSDAYTEAANSYKIQREALDEAKAAYEEEADAIKDAYGEIETASEESTDSINDWSTETKAAVKSASETAQEALTNLAEYLENVKSKSDEAVNSVVNGFAKIETPAQKAKREMHELEASFDSATDDVEEFNKKMTQAGQGIPTVSNMTKALEDQLAFLTEYQRLLTDAQNKGISDEILAFLSDGSLESYDYLSALQSADSEQIAKLNELYAEVGNQKNKLSDQMANNNLRVDQTYDELVKKAEESINALNMQSEAEVAAGATVTGILDGLKSKDSEITAQVDSIISQVNRLNQIGGGGFGFSLFNGLFSFGGSFATGLDFVPHDNFLANLHEGEGILTAEENRVWQAFKNGGADTRNTIDYDRIDNIMSGHGGNVYLDGRTVGKVISARQGDTYRSLERSGWQG